MSGGFFIFSIESGFFPFLMKMSQAEFIALSACTMTLTALGIDIMLPAFAEVREHFNLDPNSTTTAQIISFFFMGQVAQLIFGTLSDRFGRIAILRIGFPLYIIGGLAAAFAPTISLMLAARFVAGMGASAVFMTTIAGVRDRFVGDKMARIMSLVLTIFLFTPVLAPFMGIGILAFASWKMVFLTPPIFGMIVFVWSLRMEESLPPEKRIVLDWKTVKGSVGQVVGNKVFLRYVVITTTLFSGLSSYVASSEHIVGEIYGRPELFVWIFSGAGILLSLCTLLNSRLSSKFGARKTIKGLLLIYLVIATFLFISTLVVGHPSLELFFIPVVMMLALNLAVEPNSSALALEPLGNVAGIASSFYGTFFFFIGSVVGSVISSLSSTSVVPLVVSFFVIGIITVLLVFGDRRPTAVI